MDSASRLWIFVIGISDHKISIHSNYVLVECPENYEIVIEEMPAMLAELSAVSEEADCRKVLILGPKTKVSLETIDIYDLGAQIAGLRLKIAIVESHDAAKDDESFLEAAVFNRGGPLQFFINEEEAREWLAISYTENVRPKCNWVIRDGRFRSLADIQPSTSLVAAFGAKTEVLIAVCVNSDSLLSA